MLIIVCPLPSCDSIRLGAKENKGANMQQLRRTDGTDNWFYIKDYVKNKSKTTLKMVTLAEKGNQDIE